MKTSTYPDPNQNDAFSYCEWVPSEFIVAAPPPAAVERTLKEEVQASSPVPPKLAEVPIRPADGISDKPSEVLPALWNPNAAACWSLVFGPAFGAYLHARNADALGQREEAKANWVWFFGCLAYFGFVLLCLVLKIRVIPEGISKHLGLGLLLWWYFSLARKQIDHVKSTCQDRYRRKGWTLPLLAFCGGVVGSAFLAGVVGFLLHPANPAFAGCRRSGSGFFITENGYLLTSYHVVKGAPRIVAKTKDGTFEATLVKADKVNDLAVLKVSGSFPTLPVVTSRSVKPGDSVFTVGYPNIAIQGREPKFTRGEISCLSGFRDDPRLFQISAAVQPGNSGGPLVDAAGNVIGIVSGRLTSDASGGTPQNVNYAVKGSVLNTFLASVPELAGKLKAPRFYLLPSSEQVVTDTFKASALILVY